MHTYEWSKQYNKKIYEHPLIEMTNRSATQVQMCSPGECRAFVRSQRSKAAKKHTFEDFPKMHAHDRGTFYES